MDNDQMKNEEIEIDLAAVAEALISKAVLIILAAVFCALLAGAVSRVTRTPLYESSTTMYVLTQYETDRLTDRDLRTSEYLISDYAKMIKSRSVIEAVNEELGLGLKYEKLLSKVSVVTEDETRIIEIKVEDSDPYRARDIANAIRNTSAKEIQRVMNSEAVNVVDAANIPEESLNASTFSSMVKGGLVGFVLAAAIVVVTFLMNDTIKSPEDIEHYLGISTLGIIPVARGKVEKNSHPRKKTEKKDKKEAR